MNTANNKTAFEAAKEIALTIKPGCYRRAGVNGEPTDFCGYKDAEGGAWVIADETALISNPDAYLTDGRPLKKVN